MPPAQIIRDLNEEEQHFFQFWREELTSLVPEDHRDIVETTDGKIALIQGVLDSGDATMERPELLQALGMLFGDALAAELGLEWAVVDGEFGTMPVVTRPGTRFWIGAFHAIEKRVAAEEAPIAVATLFYAFCQTAHEALKPKKTLWGRLFGPKTI